MTFEEKIKLAEQLRSSSVLEAELPETFEQYQNETTCEEHFVNTREGDTRIYIIKKKDKSENCPLYINIHGGGFVRPHMDRDILFCSRISYEADCVTIDVDYKLAPEYPYPIAFNECYDIVKWAFENAEYLGIDPSKVVVGGHSAGGNLTAAIALKANETKDFTMRLQILDYPPMDLYTDPMEKEGADASLIPPERARAFNALYAGDPDIAKAPYVSPVFATADMMKGLPEALVITAGKDNLRFEAEQYASKLIAAGVKVTAKRYLDCRHGFMTHCVDDYMEGQKLYIETMKQIFAKEEENQ